MIFKFIKKLFNQKKRKIVLIIDFDKRHIMIDGVIIENRRPGPVQVYNIGNHLEF